MVEKFLSKKDSGSKFFFLSKKKPEGRIDDPPPHQKIVGLKFCWVIVSCPKRFFVKKKNIGRVNPGGGGVIPPPL